MYSGSSFSQQKLRGFQLSLSTDNVQRIPHLRPNAIEFRIGPCAQDIPDPWPTDHYVASRQEPTEAWRDTKFTNGVERGFAIKVSIPRASHLLTGPYLVGCSARAGLRTHRDALH